MRRCRECGQKVAPTPLSKLYQQRGFTLRELGKAAGISPSSLSRMSCGLGVTLKSMRGVAGVLGVTLDELADLIEAGADAGDRDTGKGPPA